jgi:DNA-binding MarR family transcriptional regulator
MQMKTSTFGLAYANSYRAMKGHTNRLLLPYGITAFDWALLGLLEENKQGLRVTELAELLCVSKAMISKTCKKLEQADWISIAESEGTDRRAVTYQLTKETVNKLPRIETMLRSDFRKLVSKGSRMDLFLFYRYSKRIATLLKSDIDTSHVQ